MQQSPCWKAIPQLVKGVPAFYDNPKVPYRIHKSRSRVPPLTQSNKYQMDCPYIEPGPSASKSKL